MGRVWDWLLGWVDRLRMLWKLFFGAISIHIGLGIRRANAKSITIAHKNNKNDVLVIPDPEPWLPLVHTCSIDRLIDWWLMNGGCGEMGVCCWYWWGMNALTLAESWCLVFGVWCDVYSEGEFEAGWLASMWLAGRLLRSAVVFAPMKQYGHVPSIVVWLTHGQWSYVPNKWLPARHS